VTLAPGTTAPLASFTVPDISPVVVCAMMLMLKHKTTAKIEVRKEKLFLIIVSPIKISLK
jgi:hypothetical protein